jgi:hypothetical protein
VAFETIGELERISEIAAENENHLVVVGSWKKKLLNRFLIYLKKNVPDLKMVIVQTVGGCSEGLFRILCL